MFETRRPLETRARHWHDADPIALESKEKEVPDLVSLGIRDMASTGRLQKCFAKMTSGQAQHHAS